MIGLNSAILFEYATIDRLSAFIADTYRDQLKLGADGAKAVNPLAKPLAADSAPARRDLPVAAGNLEIAVIGMAGQFPGAKDVETLWRNLIAGKEGIADLPASY